MGLPQSGFSVGGIRPRLRPSQICQPKRAHFTEPPWEGRRVRVSRSGLLFMGPGRRHAGNTLLVPVHDLSVRSIASREDYSAVILNPTWDYHVQGPATSPWSG